MKTLVLVDIQNDFCKGGALAVKDGDAVVPVANRLIVEGKFDLIVATQDYHPPTHKSFASNNKDVKVGTLGTLNGLPQVWWPNHCTWGSKGAEFHKNLLSGRLAAIFRKGMDPEVDSYSGFFDNGRKHPTGLAGYLKDVGATELFVLGLATDYCVKFTALDAVSLGFKTNLVLDGCRAVNLNPDDGAKAVAEMKEKGVKIIEKGDSLLVKLNANVQ